MTQPRRVLFIADILPVGGSEIFLLNLLNGLDPRMIRSVVISLGSSEDIIYGRIRDDIPKHVHARRWKYDLSPARELRRRIGEYQADTVFCLGLFAFFFLRRALGGGDHRKKIILSLHSTTPRTRKEALLGYLYTRFLTGRERIVTVSTNQQDFYVKRYGIPAGQFMTIHNGIDTGHWTPPPPSFDSGHFRAGWGIPRDAIVIVNVAMFRREKRHDLMVRALRSMPPDVAGRPVYVVFVGDGEDEIEAATRRLALELGVGKQVIIAGLQKDVRPFYWTADMFTLASTAAETFSLATLEALSTGLPCVVTDIGGANEMISNGTNGYLVTPDSPENLADGWLKAARGLDASRREPIREDVVNRFDLRECIRRYQELLTEEPMIPCPSPPRRHSEIPRGSGREDEGRVEEVLS